MHGGGCGGGGCDGFKQFFCTSQITVVREDWKKL